MSRASKIFSLIFIVAASGCGREVQDISRIQDVPFINPHPISPSEAGGLVDKEFGKFEGMASKIDLLFNTYARSTEGLPSVGRCLEVDNMLRKKSLSTLWNEFSGQGDRMVQLGLMDRDAVTSVLISGAASLLVVAPEIDLLASECAFVYPNLMSRKLTVI